ncbi:restriction endonuclease subunit S [Bifidobacterium longum]|uniref:restriction endonuclease subunit S n=1 Tax=Bifidobacterium longum TaxID=216816 RepID=UPI003D7FC9AF
MTEQAKVPAIRFAGFTDPWEQRKLIMVAPLQRGFDLPAEKIIPGVYPVMMSNGIGAYHNEYKVKGPGVVTGRSGTIGNLQYVESAFWPHNTTLWVTKFYGNHPKFIYYLYEKIDLKRYKAGSGVPTLNRNDVHDTMVFFPASRKEQELISAVLTYLDDLITLHQRKYDKLVVFKKSMLEKMFPKDGESVPEIRFAGFTDPWEQRKFSNLTDRVSMQSSDPDLPQVEYEDIVSGEGTLNKDLRDKEGGKTGIKFYAGDVLYGKLRPYLMNWLYPQFNGVAVGDFWVLRATECDSSFLYRLVQTDSFQRLANVSSGSKMPRADWNLISQSFFAVPADYAEQRVIAKSLAELDDLITLHQRKLELLQNIKKSLLDKMFA